MSKTRIGWLFSAAALGLGLTIPAGATNITIQPGVMTSSQAGPLTTWDFNSGTWPGNFTATADGTGIVNTSREFVYLQPAGDSTFYGYAGPGGSVTETFGPGGVNYVGMYWGSPDQYNMLTFTDTMGNTFTYGGSGTPIPGLTPKWQGNVDSYVNFFDTGNNWVSVTWTSTTAAFEFDNVTTTALVTATPEPASIALLAGGFLAIGAGALRRRRNSK